MKNVISIFLIAFAFSACTSEGKKSIIANPNTCWSLIVEGEVTYEPYGHCYSFYPSNKYEEFFYTKNNEKEKYSYGDQVFTDDWELKDDSILLMSGFNYKIKYLSSDSMILLSPSQDLMKFVSLNKK